MPRIDPLKLLVCLSVLLAPNGGIRSANEVKRLANLMAKFSKKLVSKCIYIQILKCTETELLGQFMAAGGWSLVHMWLADGITTKNWPLIQELLELLLCCPVDVERLKSNTAPKLVKTLSKDSSHEGVRLLATKLVEQWLKIARNDIRSGNQQQQQQSSQQSSPAQQSGSSSSDDKLLNPEDSMPEETKDVDESSHEEEEVLDETTVVENGEDALDAVAIESADAEHTEDGVVEETAEGKNDEGEEDVEETKKAFNAAVADSNSKKTPLLFKITMKNGKQVLAKVESPTKKSDASLGDDEEGKPNVEEDGIKNEVKEEEQDQTMTEEGVSEVEETDSTEKLNKSVSDNGDKDEKKDKSEVEKEKDKDRRKSVDKDRSKDSKDKSSSKDKDKHRDKKSSSSGHRSSSSKSSSSSSKHNTSTSSTSSSKGKSSSSSSSGKSSGSSSKDKDKEKDRNSSSSSSKNHQKHSSSTKSSSRSSSSSSTDKHREHKDKDKSSHSSKDKDGQPKISSPSSSSKLDKIPKKSRDGADEKSDSSADNSKPSPANSNKKASISIEVRNAEHRPKTVKTFNSQFRSHGLIEEAPPPPSRKGLKKPSTTTPGVVGSTATGTVHTKRSSPPPSSKDGPPEKKAREEPAERPGAIKLIPPKRQPSLIESDMFMDALSATLKKDVKKRKRKLSGSEPGKVGDQKAGAAPSTPTTPTTPTPEKPLAAAKAASPEKTIQTTPPASPTREEKAPVTSTAVAAPSSPVPAGPASPPTKVVAAPMSFYRDTLADSEENAEDKKEQPEEKTEPEAPAAEAAANESGVETTKPEEIPDTPAEPDNNNGDEEDEDDVVKKPKRLKSELIEDDDGDDRNNLIDAVGDDVAKKMEAEVPEKKLPGPGCGPDGPPGVLVIHRRKGPKKQLKWKTQEDLEEVRYFELDVTERCNVTRTFTDLKHLERVDERNKYMLARKVDAEDMMVERTTWLPLIAIDNVPPHPEGVNSQERRIQQNRERTILQALYFNRHMIPDSPAEPDVEVYSISEPVHIPMDDVTGNPDSINDFTSMPWPEPKSTPPHESAGFNSPFFPGSGAEFPPFGNTSNWELPGANAGPLPGMFPPGRMPPMGGNNGPPPGAPPMMRQMNMPHNMPPNMGGPPHPNMFQNNFVRGPHPMQQHMNDRDDETFRNGPPPPPAWFGGNSREGSNRGPPSSHQGNFHNRSGGGGGGRGGGGGNWNNNRDHDRGGPRGSNYRPPWLNNNRGNQNSHRGGGGGRKW